MTEKKTTGPGNTAIKIIQSKDRKEKDLKRWKKRKGTPVTCKTQKLESHKGAEKILEEIMAKVFDKNYKPTAQRKYGAHQCKQTIIYIGKYRNIGVSM